MPENNPDGKLSIDFPGHLGELLASKHRYKVIYGGRGGGRSWGCARALLIFGMKKPMRILCTREVQNSIKDSVHKLLGDQIKLLGLGYFYTVLETTIRGINGTEFIFAGLSQQTTESLKSYEGIDVTWCEEAQAISKRSWDILVPTIRKDGSEIWVTFNPSLETDETYQRFIKNPPPDCASLLLNYSHNPFFPPVLEQERQHCQAADPDNYPNIWEGACKPAVEGAIYAREIQEAVSNGRICRLPYDPLLRVHVVFDLGFNDHMAISLVQRHVSEIRIIDYIQDTGRTLNDYSEQLKTRKYNWGRLWLPHDGYSSDYKTGFSSASIMRRLGWDVPDRSEISELSIEEGIRVTKLSFPQIYIDAERCGLLVECLKRYRRRINRETMTPGAPLHDEFCLPAGTMISMTDGVKPVESVSVGENVALPGGMVGKVIRSNIVGSTNKLIEITLSDGKALSVTFNHMMLTDKGIVFAKDLSYNDLILTNNGGILWRILKWYSRVERIGLREAITRVMTSGSKAQGIYTKMFGLSRMGQYRRVIISIILTTINSIMPLKTWQSCQCPHIDGFMAQLVNGNIQIETSTRYCRERKQTPPLHTGRQSQEQKKLKTGNTTINSGRGLAQRGLWKLSIGRNLQQRIGTEAKKEESGTQNTVKKYGRIESLLLPFVRCAVKSILLLGRLYQNSATKIVRLRRLDVEDQPIYNLTVDLHHCYIANGMLVSNSDGADCVRYVCVNASSMHNADPGEQFWANDHDRYDERAVNSATGY